MTDVTSKCCCSSNIERPLVPFLKVDGLLFHVTRGPDHSSIIWLFYRNANLSIEVSLNAQVCKKIVTGVNSKCCCLSYIERPLVSGQDWTWMLIGQDNLFGYYFGEQLIF